MVSEPEIWLLLFFRVGNIDVYERRQIYAVY